MSQSDQTHEQEEEVTEDCPNSQRPEGGRNTLFDTKPMEVEASDMEDLSSVCAPERVGSTLHEVRCSVKCLRFLQLESFKATTGLLKVPGKSIRNSFAWQNAVMHK